MGGGWPWPSPRCFTLHDKGACSRPQQGQGPGHITTHRAQSCVFVDQGRFPFAPGLYPESLLSRSLIPRPRQGF